MGGWEWVFSGVGGAAVVAAGGYVLRRWLSRQDAGPAQRIQSGNNSTNIQAGRDASLTQRTHVEKPAKD